LDQNKNQNSILEIKNVSKIFNKKFYANKNINLNIKRNTVHAILGENGAGKSTLMSIISGFQKPTFGSYKLNSNTKKPVRIGMVHQHFELVNNFTALQNIILGNELTEKNFNFFIDYKKAANRIQKIMNKYDLIVDLKKKVYKLTVGDQQKIEILKILYTQSDLLILDEPTAVLSVQEIKKLFEIIRFLIKEGKTVIFISHKLHEIKEIADKVTILRNGEVIETFNVNQKTTHEIANLMVGRELKEIKNTIQEANNNDVVLQVKNLTATKHKITRLKNINFNIRKGEILAIAGLQKNGQIVLLEAIAGILNRKNIVRGNILVNRKSVLDIPVAKRYWNFLSYIPEDRFKHGIVKNFNIITNLMLHNLNKMPYVNYGFINNDKNIIYGQKIINQFNIKNAHNGFSPTSNLSGGNQQKIIVGRELTNKHDLLLVAQPTRGIDVGAIEYVYSQILKEKQNNKAVLLVSYELDEILALADRILVMSHGEIVGEISGHNATKEKIARLMIGKKNNNKEFKEINNETK